MKISKLNSLQMSYFKGKKKTDHNYHHEIITNYIANKNNTSDNLSGQPVSDSFHSYSASKNSQAKETPAKKIDLSRDKRITNAIKAYKKHGIDAKFNDDGTIKLNRFYNCNFSEKDVNEKHFFQYVTLIVNDADFGGTKIAELPKLESVGGKLILRDSEIKSAINLKSVGKNSDLSSPNLKELPKLEIAGINTTGLENIYTPKLKEKKKHIKH